MRKYLFVVLFALIFALCFSGCDSTPEVPDLPEVDDDGKNDSDVGENVDNENGDNVIEKPEDVPAVEKSVYETLDELAKKLGENVTINVTTLTGDITLNAEYVLSDSTIEYSVEKVNLITEDLSSFESGFKSTLEGTAVVKDGVITHVDGDPVEIPEYDELSGKFSFDESNFCDVTLEDGCFSASVKSVKGFLGIEKGISDMTVKINYISDAIEKVLICYQTFSSVVNIEYYFG